MGQNLLLFTHGAGKAAVVREYGLSHLSSKHISHVCGAAVSGLPRREQEEEQEEESGEIEQAYCKKMRLNGETENQTKTNRNTEHEKRETAEEKIWFKSMRQNGKQKAETKKKLRKCPLQK